MSGLPQRQTVVAQATEYLTNEIGRGAWQGWLPNERALCESLHVSRGTLRSALQQLAASGLIRPEHGRGNRILASTQRKRKAGNERAIGLLTPQPLEQLRPTQTLWIDELRTLLVEQGCKFHVVSGTQYFRANPSNALKKLIRQHPYSCWILIRSKNSTQAWFQENRHPCVVAGSPSPGIDLPFVDLDHYALCHHAAGTLLRMGHRRIAFISERTGRAGEAASEAGFVEAVRQSKRADADPLVLLHESTAESLGTALKRLMSQPRRPTALLVANPHFYLTVTSRLAQLGLRVPQDISIISRDEDPFLSFLLPRPARYAIPPHVFAKKLMRPLMELADGRIPSIRSTRIMPHFIRGESIQAVASPEGGSSA